MRESLGHDIQSYDSNNYYRPGRVGVPSSEHMRFCSLRHMYTYMYIIMISYTELSHGFYSVWDIYRMRAVCTSEGGVRGSTYSTRAVLSHAL